MIWWKIIHIKMGTYTFEIWSILCHTKASFWKGAFGMSKLRFLLEPRDFLHFFIIQRRLLFKGYLTSIMAPKMRPSGKFSIPIKWYGQRCLFHVLHTLRVGFLLRRLWYFLNESQIHIVLYFILHTEISIILLHITSNVNLLIKGAFLRGYTWIC